MTLTERNRVKITGNGTKTIIFAHGFACDQSVWDRVAPAFEKDFRVIRFDHIGNKSQDAKFYDNAKYSSYQGYAQDLVQIIDELKLTDTIFVGHSASSMIGMLASIERPNAFSKLVMIGPSACYLNEGDYKGGFDRPGVEGILAAMSSDYASWAAQMAPMFMGTPNRPELGAELVQMFQTQDAKMTPQFGRTVFMSDHRGDVKKYTKPTLIIQCTNDPVSSSWVCDYLKQQFKDSKLVVLNVGGHYPQISAPQETIRAIREFIA
ncbi:alpha/beta hydrolase [Bdellovibrio sp. SKB1291214]|uniref:alpha/beta fold hydrolase n=1 Tax=Bdellovibrio sp. SKB1291214 TaxID=1732569 RepID=UPI000B517A09|nr:alpha/beta hydrolase [Bdellovibrio sp. SKB1291214]UYL07225.1 alpha/beta hydrolase [Bdellovibrio sp. SKB1291214]